jgi:hypothetical protein
MDETATCEAGLDSAIDEVRYLNDLAYRRRIHEDLEIEGDEPMDLSLHPEGDLVLDSDEALRQFMDDILREVLDEIAAESRVHTASP